MSRSGIGAAVAALALVVAVGSLGLLLLAGAGTRMGWWPFRTGLGLLAYAAYGGVAAMVLGVLAIGLGLMFGGRALLGALALLIGLAAFLPPYMFQRTARSLPPIHDVSTDTEDPPRYVAIVPLRRSAANAIEYGGPDVAAQQHRAYPDIRPARLSEPPPRAFERALAAARAQGWEIVDTAPAEGRIEATDTTRWFGFKDDVVVRVRPEGTGSRVDVRSLSRVGRGDVGKNAARVRAYLHALGS
jgi:uncharacterized protein (DUF1499 family)